MDASPPNEKKPLEELREATIDIPVRRRLWALLQPTELAAFGFAKPHSAFWQPYVRTLVGLWRSMVGLHVGVLFS